jgi:hypothetical protein
MTQNKRPVVVEFPHGIATVADGRTRAQRSRRVTETEVKIPALLGRKKRNGWESIPRPEN